MSCLWGLRQVDLDQCFRHGSTALVHCLTFGFSPLDVKAVRPPGTAHSSLVDMLAAVFVHEPAALDDEDAVGRRSSTKLNTCSHDNDADIVADAADLVQQPRDVLDDRWLNAFGRLVQQQHLGFAASARAMASCCCWPPERLPPRRLRISPAPGKTRRSRRGHFALAASREAGVDVFLDRQLGERSSGPAARRPCRWPRAGGARARVTSGTVHHRCCPERAGMTPIRALNSVVLPMPLRPMSATISPGLTARSMP